MDIKRLKYFCMVVECGNITKAANALHISQPPLSKRLQEFEEEVGAPLLLRHTGRVEPTPVGYFLYERAVEVLRHLNNVENEVRVFATQHRKTLHIGLTHLYQRYFTPLMMRIREQCPHVDIGVMVSDSSHLETLLHNHVIDVALIQKPARTEGYDCITFGSIGLVAVIHRELLPAGNSPSSIHLHDLGTLPLIMLRRANGTGTFEFLTDKMRKSGVVPNILMHVSQPNVIVDWIESGVEAAALLPASEVRPEDLQHSCVVRVMPDPQVFFLLGSS